MVEMLPRLLLLLAHGPGAVDDACLRCVPQNTRFLNLSGQKYVSTELFLFPSGSFSAPAILPEHGFSSGSLLKVQIGAKQ